MHRPSAPSQKSKLRFNTFRSICSATAVMLCATAALAIHPGDWTHTTEADFEKGEIEGVVVTNLGDIKLATATQSQGDLPEGVNVIYDMRQTPDGKLYLAAGPGGRLLRKDGDKIEQLLALENEHIFALDVNADGSLLLGISGEKSRLAFLDGDKLKNLVTLDSVRYIWDTVVDGNDVYLATGPDGLLLHVNLAEVFANKAKEDAAKPNGNNNDNAGDGKAPAPAPDGKDAAKPANPDQANQANDDKDAKPDEKPKLPSGVRIVLDATQANLICLERDVQGRLFAGTDTDGLIYRITMQPGQEPASFVVYDADEPEIGALVVLADGTIYAGTADAGQARKGRLQAAKTAESGRPSPGSKPANVEVPSTPKPDPKATGGEIGNGKTGNATGVQPIPGSNAVKPDKPAANAVAPDGTGDNGDTKVDQPIANATANAPTPDQYDQLRQEIRDRLMKARQTGELQVSSGSSGGSPSRATRPSTSRPTTTAKRPSKAGNAIYRIDANGFVTEVFRETVMILRIVVDGESLLVATGNEGQIFRVNPSAEETIIVADLDPAQIPAMLKTKEGAILIGTESPASLVRLNGGFAEKGVYTSQVLDASQISLWGKLHLTGNIPEGATVSVETRSGNVEDPDRAAWSNWSMPIALPHDPKVTPLTPRELTVSSPPARFFQYRLSMTGNGKTTSVVDRISMAYVVPNIKPSIESIRATYVKPKSTADSQERTKMNIAWKATDDNKDALRYRLDYRRAGTTNWLELAADLDRDSHEWETRRVPDGRYLLRVTATDEPDNPSTMAKTARRQSDPILIDNTPPTIGERQTRIENGVATIKTSVVDALSGIDRVQYAVDSTEDWKALLPDDLIYDSTSEGMTVKILGLSPGSHVVTLRATDKLGNTQYTADVIEIK